MRKLLIVAALAAATAAPAFARTTETAPEPGNPVMQATNLSADASVSEAGLRPAPEAAPIVEARARQRR